MPVPAVTCITCNAALATDHTQTTFCMHHQTSCPKYKSSCYLRLDPNERMERCEGCGMNIPYRDLVTHLVENHIFN